MQNSFLWNSYERLIDSNAIKKYTLSYKNKLHENHQAEISNKIRTNYEHIVAGKFKNKKLLPKEWCEHCQSYLLWCNKVFLWGITLYSSRVVLKYSIFPMSPFTWIITVRTHFSKEQKLQKTRTLSLIKVLRISQKHSSGSRLEKRCS